MILILGLLQRLEEDVNVNTFIVKEKLPKEVAAKQQLVSTLQKVAAQPAMGQQELDAINKKVTIHFSEIFSMIHDLLYLIQFDYIMN